MYKKRGIAALLVTVMMLSLLGGCAKKFDAAGYTKAVLDLTYKDKTEQYLKLTKSTKEQADKVYSDNLDGVMNQFLSLKLSKEMMDNYRQFFKDLIKEVKYTVGEAKQDKKGNYTVDVTVEPILLFDNTYDEFKKQSADYAQKVSADAANGAAMPSQNEIESHIFDIYYKILRSGLDKGLEYGTPEVVTVHVNKTKGNIYEIPQKDLVNLDSKTISLKSLQ